MVMGLGCDLKNEFYRLTRNGNFDEVELFTKLQDSFIELSCKTVGYNISLVHGNRSLVSFEISESWMNQIVAGTTKICELSDMLFVIYDTKKAHCRMFFMQNKNDDRVLSEKFKADLVQLDLLSHRSQFTDIRSGNVSSIFLNAEVNSITTYGVFHRKGICYDMKCYSADLIEPVTQKGESEKRVVQFKGTLGKIRHSINRGIEDYEGLAGLEEFGTAIENLKIGEPIGKSTIIKLKHTFANIPAELLVLDLPEMNDERKDDNSRFSQVSTVCFIRVNVDTEK